MWDNDYKEPSRKASGAQGRMTCLQQPWESSSEPPLEQTTQPHRAQGCSLPPDTVKPFETNTNEGPGCKIRFWAPQGKGLLWEASYRSSSPLHQLKTVSQTENFVFKKMKLPTKRRDPSKESLQATQMLVWFFYFILQANSCSSKFLPGGPKN